MKDGKKYILVADDDREIREIVSLLLSSEGYAVLTAEDGIQAARLASGEIDLYLLDVNMPGQSGILAASQIRKQFETPIVFLTAYSSESDKVMGFSVGAARIPDCPGIFTSSRYRSTSPDASRAA